MRDDDRGAGHLKLTPAVLEEMATEMAAELAELFPEPVDVFEDGLAGWHGLERHPGCSLESWRRVLVQFLEGLG